MSLDPLSGGSFIEFRWQIVKYQIIGISVGEFTEFNKPFLGIRLRHRLDNNRADGQNLNCVEFCIVIEGHRNRSSQGSSTTGLSRRANNSVAHALADGS